MPDSTVFREKLEIPEEATASEMEEIILQNDDVQGATKVSEESDEPKERKNALDDWELEHGKYGVELFGIKVEADLAGDMLYIVTSTAFAHVVTGTNLFQAGETGGPFNKITTAAFAGSGAILIGHGGLWLVIADQIATIGD